MAAKKTVGKVIHYYDKIGVAIIKLGGALKTGDVVKFVKGDDEFEQTIGSMQIEKAAIDSGKKGDVIGVKTDSPTKEGTLVQIV